MLAGVSILHLDFYEQCCWVSPSSCSHYPTVSCVTAEKIPDKTEKVSGAAQWALPSPCSLDLQAGRDTRVVSRPAAGSSCSLRLGGLCLCCSSQHSMDQVIMARPGPQSLGKGGGGLDKWVTRLLSPQVLNDLSSTQIVRQWSSFFLLASKAAHSK